MSAVPRTACVVVALLALGASAAVAASGAARPPEQTQEFAALLEQTAQAHEQGDDATALARLRQAARLLRTDEFHQLLSDAGAAYDQGRLATARGRLKRAIRRVNPWFWFALGLVAQALFTGRFVVQWVASERQKKSVIPVSFWYLSISGSLLLLTYAIWRQDPVFILGQAFGSIVYVRNLTFIHRTRAREACAAPNGDACE